MSDAASVKVRALSKRFGRQGEVVGVDAVSFEAPERGITALLGPSGSGKSTILRLIAGLEVPNSGEVWIGAQEVTHSPVQAREVGFVFQNYALFRHLSVFDNVAFGLSVRGVASAAIRKRVEELLELVQLGAYARRLPSELSGGQRQRVALARSLATSPRVLLLDEPFGALDTQVRVELREWLRRLQDETRVTTVLVTHDQEEALELSDHVVLLRDGRVEQCGPPMELYERPKNGFVASFLGGAKVLKGSVERGRAQFAERALEVSVDIADGAKVAAVVRPHHVQVSKAGGDEVSARVASVERVVRVGSFIKLALRLPDGDRLMVQMAPHELEEANIHSGDRVVLGLRQVQVTAVEDYVI